MAKDGVTSGHIGNRGIPQPARFTRPPNQSRTNPPRPMREIRFNCQRPASVHLGRREARRSSVGKSNLARDSWGPPNS